MGKKDEYFTNMQSDFKREWDAEVDKLNAKGVQMSADTRAGYDIQVKALRAGTATSRTLKLEEIRTANRISVGTHANPAWTRGLDLDEERFEQGCRPIQVTGPGSHYYPTVAG